MTEQSKWTTIFQVTIAKLKEPKKFERGRKKFLEKLWQEIKPIRTEIGYDPSRPYVERLAWQLENKELVRTRMLDVSSKFLLPDDEEFLGFLVTVFYEGIESSMLFPGIISPEIDGATPLFFRAIALPPDVDKLELQDRERILMNDLYIEGRVPGLSRSSLEQIFKRKGDYVIRGNLALFDANAFREVGKWLEEIKKRLGSGEVFDIKRGRLEGYKPAPKCILGNMTWDDVIGQIRQNPREANRLWNQYINERTEKFQRRFELKHGHSPSPDEVRHERVKAIRYFKKQLRKRIKPEFLEI